jgi:hypothetical protein
VLTWNILVEAMLGMLPLDGQAREIVARYGFEPENTCSREFIALRKPMTCGAELR